ncbi:MAG TPA: Flp pilus assembly protein CpaB [Acidimicrobiales bacterium]|nr:Flp pilus assembly protein CpaB [Acidimicrobiales bacterium]
MNRKPKALFAAIGLALAGTLLLAGYVKTSTAEASAADELVAVLVVQDTIAAGTPAAEMADLVSTEEVAADAAADGAITDLDDVAGLVADVDILAGEQLLASRFVPASQMAKAAVPPGLMEITVSLDPTRALGGMLRAGQQVAVVASLDDAGDGQPATALILEKITVTRVQSTEPMPSDTDTSVGLAPTGTMLVTLAVDAASAEQIVFAAEQGRLWLSGMPEGASAAGTTGQNKATALR